MKQVCKLILFVAAFLFLVGGVPGGVYAAAPSPITISGTVTNKGRPVVGAPVTADCREPDGELRTFYIDTVHTSALGYYHIVFPVGEPCQVGWATIVITPNYPIDDSSWLPLQKDTVRNIELGPNYSVPEYNWPAGLVAVSGGMVGVVLIRHRWRFSR